MGPVLCRIAVMPDSWLAEHTWGPQVDSLLSVFEEALLVTTPAAANYLPLERGRRPDERIDGFPVGRYLRRMTTRCTPLGLFAGVALVDEGPQTSIRVAPATSWKRSVFPPVSDLAELIRELEQDRPTLDQLPLAVDGEAYVSGARIVAPAFGLDSGSRSLRYTAPVAQILSGVRRGGLVGRDVLQMFEAGSPDNGNGASDRAAGLLLQLLSFGVLRSHLWLSMLEADPLASLADAVEQLPETPRTLAVSDRLREISAARQLYEGAPLGTPPRPLPGAAGASSEVVTTGDPQERDRLWRVNLRAEVEGTFGRDVLDGAGRLAGLLWATSPVADRTSSVAEYAEKFIERYGSREVPLKELVDPYRGLGPLLYENPRPPDPVAGQPSPRDALLGDWIVQSIRDRALERRISAGDLRNLIELCEQPGAARPRTPPPSGEIYIELGRDPGLAGDAPLLAIAPRGTTDIAGTSYARFGETAGPAIEVAMRTFCETEFSVRTDGRIPVEMIALPRNLAAAGLATRTAPTEYCVRPVYECGDGVISLDDFTVGYHDDQFYVRSATLESLVEVRHTSVLSEPNLSPIVQSLLNLSRDRRGRLPLWFDWGSWANSPVLPRLRVDNLVLTRARRVLMLDADRVPFGPRATADQVQGMRVPGGFDRFIRLVDADQRLVVDLDDSEQVDDLVSEMRKAFRQRRPVAIEEALPGPGQYVAASAHGRHAIELVVPLIRRRRESSVRPTLWRREPVSEPERYKWPGSDWRSVKVYLGPEEQDDFLLHCLRPWMRKWQRSPLFVRYRDPDNHLRIRWQCAADSSWADVEALLREASRWGVVRMVIDTYDQEVERYGGPEAMAICRRLFVWDAMRVLDILAASPELESRLARLQCPDPQFWLRALDTVHFIVSLVGDRSRASDLLRSLNQGLIAELAPNHQKTREQTDGWIRDAADFVQSAEPAVQDVLGAVPLGSSVEREFESLRAVLTGEDRWNSMFGAWASIVHMHFNRLGLGALSDEARTVYAAARILSMLVHRDSEIPLWRQSSERLSIDAGPRPTGPGDQELAAQGEARS